MEPTIEARWAAALKACGIFNPAEVAGLAEAIKEENFFWDTAFLGMDEVICGFRVKPLSAYHLIYLSTVQSPFLLNVNPEFFYITPGIDNHIKRFMWIVSKRFKPESRPQRKLFFFCHRWLFEKQVNEVKAIDLILEYLNKSMADCTQGSSSGSYCSIAASMIDRLCHEYGWDYERALHCPLKVAFQLIKCINYRNGERVAKRSDRIMAEYLEIENQKLRAKN